MRPSPPSFDHLLGSEHEHRLPHPIQVQIWRNGRSKYQRVRTAGPAPGATAATPAGATVRRRLEAPPAESA